MKYAIHINILSAVFQDSTEKSKQTSQLLFGELCTIKSERDDFLYIENWNDKHSGWVLNNIFVEISIGEAEKIKNQPIVRVSEPLAEIFDLKNKTILRLPAGSAIPNYNPNINKFTIGEIDYQIHPSFVSYLPHGNLNGVVEIARSFLNAPFAYGGKSILGVDSTGLVQLVLGLCGYFIPRGVQDQMKIGVPVYSLEQLRMGDIVFIDTNSSVINVLVYLKDDKLIGIDRKVTIIDISEVKTDVATCIIRRLV